MILNDGRDASRTGPTLVGSERLERARTAVRNFDIITIALILIPIVCVALTLWLCGDRAHL